MPGSIRSMHVEHVFRDVQTDRGSLLHGRLLRWHFDTVTLAHRCRRGASTPSPVTTAVERRRSLLSRASVTAHLHSGGVGSCHSSGAAWHSCLRAWFIARRFRFADDAQAAPVVLLA